MERKLQNFVYSGNLCEVQQILRATHDKTCLQRVCLQAAVAFKQYHIVEYCVGLCKPHTDITHCIKLACRSNDQKMLDILLLPQPNASICSPAALEAVERDDLTSVKKLLPRSDFITCAPNFLQAAVECESVHSLKYMISQVNVKNEFGENLLKSAVQIRPNGMDNAGLVVSCIVEHLTSENLKNVIDRIAPCSHQKNMKHVHEHFEVLRQHELLTQAVNDTPANHMVRKKM